MADISMATNVFNKREVVRTYPETKNSPPEIDGLTTIFPLGPGLMVNLLLVSRSVTVEIPTQHGRNIQV